MRTVVKSCATCYVFTVLFAAAPASAYAECILATADLLLQRTSSEVVFSGTVVEVTRTADFGYRATFAVDRVCSSWTVSVTLGDLGLPRVIRFTRTTRSVIPKAA